MPHDPTSFSPELRARLAGAVIREELNLAEKEAQLPSDMAPGDRLVARVEWAALFVMNVFREIACPPGDVGRQVGSSVTQFRDEADEYVKHELIPLAFRRARLNRSYPMRAVDDLQQAVYNDLHRSMWPEFLKHLQAAEKPDIDDAIPDTLAKWLQAKLTERGWDVHELHRRGGPVHETSSNALRSGRIQGVAFDRIVTGLNKAKNVPEISEDEIRQWKASEWVRATTQGRRRARRNLPKKTSNQ